MIDNADFRIDEDLLDLARTVLTESGFVAELTQSETVLLAENQFAIVALAATPTLADLLVAEAPVEALLRTRMAEADVGPKIWDAYLVLLTQESSQSQGRTYQRLFGINYDTHEFRRIARVGVGLTLRDVRNALTPFVEPLRLNEAGLSVDALDSLPVALNRHGISIDVAERAVEIFRQRGRIDDAL